MSRYFSEDHEWIDLTGDIATVGITEYAQGQLGDIVFVELPVPGTAIKAGAEAAVVESVKAASDVYCPVAGEVTEINTAIEDEPALVNESAEGDGWFFRLRLADPDQVKGLLDEAAYRAYLATLD